MMTTQTLFLWGWLASASLMLVLWVIQLFRHNAGTVDVAWAFATASLGIGFVIGSEVGDPERRTLVAVLGGIWGLRLGLHLFRRLTAEAEDSRYRYLRSSLGSKAQFVFFLFFQIQALWAVLFAAPLWAAARSPVPGLQWHDWVGGAIWMIAIVGESVADAELSRFRHDPANRGKVCQSGLWRYSRHPNYFFEWVHWWAYVFIGIGSDWWWVTLAGALVMAVFLLKVTGIPHTERQALRKPRGGLSTLYGEDQRLCPPSTQDPARLNSMSAETAIVIECIERGLLPDRIIRKSIRHLLGQRLAELRMPRGKPRAMRERQFIAMMDNASIAPIPHKANQQHYELPPAFFSYVLGKHRKYSCCYWGDRTIRLNEAEEAALRITCERAGLEKHMRVLDLGCGWGSLSLWIAERYPQSRVTGVSNSHSQREFILAEAKRRELSNVDIITADMNTFTTEHRFERVVSVEMFEHMRNYRTLFRRIASWLEAEGRFFMHIFCHGTTAYEFIDEGPGDWMSRHFFAGGMMPSDTLPERFQEQLTLIEKWRWNGCHYAKTAEAWLQRMEQNKPQIWPILEATYGKKDARRWWIRWRIFFMACAELFGYNQGQEWGVSHYLFERPGRH